MFLNINTTGCVVLTNKLEKISRSALPIAIRGALNQTVKNIKQNTMPASARDKFNQRQKNFFTANSKFEYAKGFKINDMKAMVGFYENKLSNATTNFAIKDLEEQEHGGNIRGKTFIPMHAARVGGVGNVKKNVRLSEIHKNIIDATRVRSISGHSAKKLLKSVKTQKIIRAAFKAKQVYGNNAFILGNVNAAGKQTLFKVGEISTNIVTRKLNVHLIPLYNVETGRSVRVKATSFMKNASLLSAKKMEYSYMNLAQKQLQKYYGK